MDGIAIGRIALVAASAAMGGFLFGFDTAVINGAVDAIKVWSGAASWLLGFAVAGALLGSAMGAWFGRSPGGSLRAHCRHGDRCRHLLRKLDRHRARLEYRGVECIPFLRRHRNWRSKCHRAGIYRRGISCLISGTFRFPSAVGDRQWYFRRTAL
jgi:hypothetical protein